MSGRRRSDRALRPVLKRSPGRPGVAQRENRRRFWAAIATGVSSEEAASGAGVVASGRLPVVPGSGRHATEDTCTIVEAKIGAAPVVCGARRDRVAAGAGLRGTGDSPAAGSGRVDDLAWSDALRPTGATRPRAAATWSIGPQRRSGMPSEQPAVLSRRSWR